jgi:hypothetical protein
MNLILVRGKTAFATVEQIFDDVVKASYKMQELRANGYSEEWIDLPWSSFEEMNQALDKYKNGMSM